MMTKAEILAQLEQHYGEAGYFAYETSCITDADFELGYDHVLGLILPALEEELSAQNGDLG